MYIYTNEDYRVHIMRIVHVPSTFSGDLHELYI